MNLFNFFNKKNNKEFTSCEWLEYGIHFMTIGINNCCMYSHSTNNDKPLSNIQEKDNTLCYNLNDFLSKKKRMQKQQRKGIIDKRCENCCNLETKVWENKNKFTRIVIEANTTCNANCIYCYTHQEKKRYNSISDISILNILKKLIKGNRIEPDCDIQIAGGEPTLHHEFEDIIKLLIENSFTCIKINTSGIKYSESIEQGLREDKLYVCISPDSGDRELYKKIKNTDSFDAVWNNISKYVQAQNKDKKRVIAKYIIIPNINDTQEDINKFIDKVIENNVRFIIVNFEIKSYRNYKNSQEFIIKMFKLVNYMQEKLQNYDIDLHYGSTIESAKSEFKEIAKDYLNNV